MSEIQNYRNCVSDEELAFLQSSVGQSDALRYETGQQKAGFLARLVEYNLQPDYVTQQSTLLKALKKEDVQASAQKYLPADKMYIVVVGDRAKAFPGLGELGYDVVEVTAEGQPVTAAPAAAPAATALGAPNAAALPDGKVKTNENGKKIKTKKKGGDESK